MPPKTEFVSFLIKAGMEAEAETWIDTLRQHEAECVATLDRERMHYESIFKSVRGGRLYLSWFSVQGAHGEHVRDSPHKIDKLHVEYWEKCIDRSAPPEVFDHLVSFVPPAIAEAVAHRDGA